MSKVGKILFITEEALRVELSEFWTDFVKNNVKGIVEEGQSYGIIDLVLFEKGIKNLTISELIDIAAAWSDTMCQNGDYQAIAMTFDKEVKLISKIYVPEQ